MTCREVDRLLMEFLDGELSDAEMPAVKGHLASCRPCASYAEAYRRAARITRWAYDTPAEFPESLVQSILQTCMGGR